MKIRFSILLFAAVIAGCTKSSEPTSADSKTPDKIASSNANSTVESEQNSTGSAAQNSAEAITVDATPEVVCGAFIRCLQRGETAQAEKFLSQESISQTRKQSLKLATPGGPEATYTFSPPMFATTQQKIAFVSIDVSESHEPQSAQAFSMMLRSGTYGWKICGIMFGPEDSEQNLYSFENPQDVLQIKAMIDGGEVRAAQSAPQTQYQ